MGKMKTLIEGLKGGVRRKLEALPPKARLGIVLTAFALFAVLCLYMTVTAIAGFGKGQWRCGTSRNWTCRCRKV